MTRKFKTAGGLQLAYSMEGEGHPVVLLHGYLESSEIWRPLFEELAGRYRVIAPDLPGHGMSELPPGVPSLEKMGEALFSLFGELGVEHYCLLGHSMGGYLALAMAAQHPEQLRAFCLFHSTPYADNDEKKLNRDRAVELIRAGKKQQLVNNHSPNTFAPFNEGPMAAKIDALKQMALKTTDQGIVYALEAMKSRPDRLEVLRGLEVPVLVIQGLHDRFIAEELSRKIAGQVPGATHVFLEHSGHMGFLEEPRASSRYLIRFLDEVNGW